MSPELPRLSDEIADWMAKIPNPHYSCRCSQTGDLDASPPSTPPQTEQLFSFPDTPSDTPVHRLPGLVVHGLPDPESLYHVYDLFSTFEMCYLIYIYITGPSSALVTQ
jgi:hypothetical protein